MTSAPTEGPAARLARAVPLPSGVKKLLRPAYRGTVRDLQRTRAHSRRFWHGVFPRYAREIHRALSLPKTVLFLFHNRRIDPAYGMTWRRKLMLGFRMYANTKRVFTGTSYKAHLAMAAKLLEIPPEIEGDVVECGCFLGGSTANLSLICEIVDRRLVVYDSFEGLPAPTRGDKYATDSTEGFLEADIEVVKANVRRCGAIERCEFRKGWFEDTLPHHDTPVVLCFLDVDYQASLRECILNLWPHLTEKGFVFIDEYVLVDYCALFFSEKFWSRYFDAKPPGLLGVGTGVGVGEYYLGPRNHPVPIQTPGSIAYTRKDFTGLWEYYPEDQLDPDAVATRE